MVHVESKMGSHKDAGKIGSHKDNRDGGDDEDSEPVSDYQVWWNEGFQILLFSDGPSLVWGRYCCFLLACVNVLLACSRRCGIVCSIHDR